MSSIRDHTIARERGLVAGSSALPPPNLSGVGEFVGTWEIAQMFGVTRQAVDLWRRDPKLNFPEPAHTFRMGSIWITADVVKWAEARGREVKVES